MLATDMGSRQLQMLPQEIRQVEPRQNIGIYALAIDVERDWHGDGHTDPPLPRSGRPSSALVERANSTLARCLRMAADACWSS